MNTTHGGARDGAGRKPTPFPRVQIRINATDEERALIAKLTPRERAEILVKAARRK